MQAVETTAIEAVKSLQEILELKENITTRKIPTLGRKTKNAQKLLDVLFVRPIATAGLISKELELSPKASNGLIQDFVSLKILKEITGYKRNRMFAFSDYMKILNR